MDGTNISVIVFIMGTNNHHENTISKIEAACDLNDLEYEIFDLSLENSELEASFYGSMKKDVIYLADFTNVMENPTRDSQNILMLSYTASWIYEKPLIVLLNKEITKNLPYGWEKYEHIIEYSDVDKKAVKKRIAKKILEFSDILESGESVFSKKKKEFIKEEPEPEVETASQRKHRLGVDASLSKKADAEASKQQELNKILKQRFREQMLSDMKKTPEELEEEAAKKVESKLPGMLRAPEGSDSKSRVPEGLRNLAEEMKDEDFRTPENEELKAAIANASPKEKSRLLELQEKYQQKVKQLELEDNNLDIDLGEATSDTTVSQKLKETPVALRTGVGYLTDSKTGEKVQLVKNELTLGRLPENDILIADSQVSKRHAVILRGVDKAYYIQDLESKHGTILQNNKIGDMTRLNDGDEIKIAVTRENSEGIRKYIFNQNVT